METFLEYETICREPAPGHVFVESLVEINPRKVTEAVRRTRHKNNARAWPREESIRFWWLSFVDPGSFSMILYH